jgi:hypothetical protein
MAQPETILEAVRRRLEPFRDALRRIISTEWLKSAWPAFILIALVLGSLFGFVLNASLGTFPSAWKSASIVLTGLFAIAGIFFDQRDKATGTITIWGRTFLWLTVISSVIGFLAQQIESSVDRAKDRAAQERMTLLLENTQTACADIPIYANNRSAEYAPNNEY